MDLLTTVLLTTTGMKAVIDLITSTDFQSQLRDAIQLVLTPWTPYSICFGHQVGTLTESCAAVGNTLVSIGMSIATLTV